MKNQKGIKCAYNPERGAMECTYDGPIYKGPKPKKPAKKKPKSSFSAGPSTYVIQDGDSLWRIAEQKLGNGLRHAEIKLANPNVNLDVLKVGMEIRLP